MTDRELLELAAKAAGYDVLWHDTWECFVHTNSQNHTNPEVWIPLDDDGDALRLAVKLNLCVFYDGNDDGGCDVTVYGNYDDYTGEQCTESFETIGYAATRRAIVRAAAEIGKTKCTTAPEAVALAKQFHETYERLAPSFGYETRPDTRVFNPYSANGKLMIAVCQEIYITPPSVDALIAEIESMITPELHNKNIYAILDKYRARGGA